MAVGVLDVVALRQGVERAYVVLGLERWGMAIASHTTTAVAGLAWIALVAWTETAYRHGVEDGRLGRRFGIVTIAEALPLGLLLWR